MDSCLIYSNAVVVALIIRQMYEMLQHPVPGALNIILRKRTIATMTRGTKCNILLQYLHTTFLMITGLLVSYIFRGVIPSYLPLNVALIT